MVRVGSIFTSVDTAETSVLCRHWFMTQVSSLLSDSVCTGSEDRTVCFFLIFSSTDTQNNEDILLACVPEVLAYVLV